MSKLVVVAEIRVPFQDADPMGVVWHGNYFRYFEEGRRALFDELDYGYAQMQQSGFAWPVVDSRIKYVRPARVDQYIRVEATLAEWENRLLIRYLISDRDTGLKLTKGHTVQVAVGIADQEMRWVSPQVLLDKVEAWLGR